MSCYSNNLTVYGPRVTQDRDAFSLRLEDTENWLYEDGEDQLKQVYIDRLTELKVANTTANTKHIIYRK